MFNPDLKNILKDHLSRYSLVTATAKRAREISEKPVSIALDEILSGKYKIIEPEEIRYI